MPSAANPGAEKGPTMVFNCWPKILQRLVLLRDERRLVLGGLLERRDVTIARGEIGVLGRSGEGGGRRQQQGGENQGFHET